MKTSSPPPSEPAADRAMDALLREHARLQTHDDEEFLAEFDQLLASESDGPSVTLPTVVSAHPRSKIFGYATLVAAACVCFAMVAQLFFQTESSPGQNGQLIQVTLGQDMRSSRGVDRQEQALQALSETADDGYTTSRNRSSGIPLYDRKMATPTPPTPPAPAAPLATTADTMSALAFNPAPLADRELSLLKSKEMASAADTSKGVAGRTLALDAIMVPTDEAVDLTVRADSGTRLLTATTDAAAITDVQATRRLDRLSRGIRLQEEEEGFQEQPSNLSKNRYTTAPPNPFRAVTTEPLSTFSVDVDTASYANLRRILQSGGSVPPEAVRIEEMINYFPYHYEEPQGEHPFSVQVESASCPWEPSHRLVKIAMKAKEIDRSKRSPANLVFLVDVSGSMQGADRLGLVVENLRVLTKALLPDDTVAIVTYAGNEGLALPPTSGADKPTILAKLDSLGAGGSTNGGAGIKLAYTTAQSRFLKDGINRVILCTDGDFNVGTTREESLVDLVAAEAKKGVFLTVCGYGSGNLNDSMMEAITNKGNGVYHYIDSAREGRKVFQDELLGTLYTVAKDVKLQIEFNPQHAAQYRLIGYNNRMLAKEDFANDKVDAGDIGAGHRVTALYEVIPVGAPSAANIDLKYQQPAATEKPADPKPLNPELLTVKLRYKEPTSDVSKPFDIPFVEDLKAQPSADLTFAATVAEFGERLRGHTAAGRTLEQLIEAAESTRENDPHGHRGEFIELMRKSTK